MTKPTKRVKMVKAFVWLQDDGTLQDVVLVQNPCCGVSHEIIPCTITYTLPAKTKRV